VAVEIPLRLLSSASRIVIPSRIRLRLRLESGTI
jgi:hypothetical protein